MTARTMAMTLFFSPLPPARTRHPHLEQEEVSEEADSAEKRKIDRQVPTMVPSVLLTE